MGVLSLPRRLSARLRSPAANAVLACVSYASCSTALTLANKAIFSEADLNYPWTLLAIQSVVSAVALAAYYGARDRRWPVSRALLAELARPCAVFTAYIFTNARALRYISLPLLSVVKSLAPMGIAVAERALYGERLSAGTLLAMALILLSNAVTVASDVEFNAWGYIWAAANALFNVLYVVALRYYVTNKHSAGEKTLHNNVLISAIIVPTALAAGEGPGFLREFADTSARFRALFALSCALAVAIGASVFWVLRATSGSTLSFVGGANKVAVVILGALLFEARISAAGWVGVALGVAASIAFSVSKARAARAHVKADSGSPAPRPSAANSLTQKIQVRSTVTAADPDALGVGGGVPGATAPNPRTGHGGPK